MNIAIIGLGLMGGSFGRTLVKKGEDTVFGYDINENAMCKAELMKAFNYRLNKENAKDIDLAIFALSPEFIKSSFEEFFPHFKKDVIINDFCGVKRSVIDLMKSYQKTYPEFTFIGGHPMAGREYSGIEHSSINLFENASMILVNLNADIFTLDRIKKFYLSVGFKNIEICSGEYHDEMIAFTSQLCHIVSNAYVKNKNAQNHDGFSAGSYRDLTRVARLNPDMWAELMIDNKDKLLSELDEIIENLKSYEVALKNCDKNELRKLLKEGSDRKIAIDSKTGK